MIENLIHDEKNDCHDETGAANRHRDEARARRLATKRDRRHEGAFTASREGEDASVRPGTRAELVDDVGSRRSRAARKERPARRADADETIADGHPAREGGGRPDLGHAVRRVASEEHAERAGRRPHHDGVRGRRGSRLGTASRSWALEWSRRVMSCAPRLSPAGLFLSFVVTGSRCTILAAFAWSRRRRRAVRC